jgi:NADPH:quinone reductase-like Zn-dependent oxidoreductase
MKAAVITQWGRNWAIEVRDVPKPVPAPDELLVKVHAATVNRTDCGELRHPWLERLIIARGTAPRTIQGMDFAGEVEAVGSEISTFKPGDRIFGMCPRRAHGGQAEYFCMPETGPVAIMPNGTTFEEAPVCEGAYYAYASVSRFCRPGSKALIYGPSGAIGVAALQLAKYFGADVTAVVAGRHVEMAKSLGADRVVDYATSEFRELGKSFDFVLDAVGKMTASQWRRLVKPDGFVAITDLGPWWQDLPFLLWSAMTGSGKVSVPLPKRGSAQEFVNFLAERMAAGQFRAIVDRKYPLAEIADAYRYVQAGEKRGIVVIDVISA